MQRVATFSRHVGARWASFRAVRVHACGGPSAHVVDELPMPGPPAAGQATVRNELAGLNFIDCYWRSGLYKRPLPFIGGTEGGGVLEAVSPEGEALGFKAGDRVVYYSLGGYTEVAQVPVAKLAKVPQEVSMANALALVGVQGMTAHYLTESIGQSVKKGETVVVHAAAGGVGRIAVQLLKARGIHVIGTSSAGKRQLAKEAGCDVVCGYEDVVAAAKERGGAALVLDGVGKDTADASLDCLRPRGTCVYYGNASGPVAPLDVLKLNAKGSLFVTRPKLGDYIPTAAEFTQRADELFDHFRSGRVRVQVDRTFKLFEGGAQAAHEYIEAGKTTGKVLLEMK